MEEKQCPFCAATQGTCGCLRLLDSLLPMSALCAQSWWLGSNSRPDEGAFEQYVVSTAESIVRERVKRYGGVAK